MRHCTIRKTLNRAANVGSIAPFERGLRSLYLTHQRAHQNRFLHPIDRGRSEDRFRPITADFRVSYTYPTRKNTCNFNACFFR
jgi:hypothetical protein